MKYMHFHTIYLSLNILKYENLTQAEATLVTSKFIRIALKSLRLIDFSEECGVNIQRNTNLTDILYWYQRKN